MVSYWERQTRTDAAVAFAITATAWVLPRFGAPIVFNIRDVQSIVSVWLGPTLTLLGIMGATTAFIFNVIERSEFKIIRGNRAESQLWRIFAQNIAWLAVSSAYCAVSTFLLVVPLLWAAFGSFLLVMLIICIAKFAWVMRAVIFVRIDQTSD